MPKKEYLFGIHAIDALLQKQSERIVQLYVQQDRRDQKIEHLIKLAEEANVPVEAVAKHELDRLTQAALHQGVVALCRPMQIYSEADLAIFIPKLKSPPFLLILDGVQDPHNLGACLRSADAAGVHAVIAPKDKSVGLTPIVSKVASGAAETVPFFQVTNLARTLDTLKEMNIWIYGADGETEHSLYQTDLRGPIAIVMGGEGSGLRRLTKERCDGLLRIPMHGTVESLNVSVAAGVFMFEVVRQRG